MKSFVLACCLLLSLAPTTTVAADQVTVYRCVDAGGQVTLSDAPCAQGSRQEVRQMQRPVDGTPLLRPRASAAPRDDGETAAPPAQVAYQRFQQLPPERRAQLMQQWHAMPPAQRLRWLHQAQGH